MPAKNPTFKFLLPVTGSRNEVICLVDRRDLAKIAPIQWLVGKNGYVTGYDPISRKSVLMHRWLLDAKSGDVIDHLNHNKRDNRRVNIRFCTPSQNNQNRSIKCRVDNKSGFRGVTQNHKKWRAYITKDGKRYELGWAFETKEEAANAYNQKARELYGEHAYQNPI